MRKKLLLSLLSAILILTSVPLLAYGAEKAGDLVQITLNAKKDKKAAGYSWDASKRTLTFNNAKLKNKKFYISTKSVTIILKGDSTMTGLNGNQAVLCSGDCKKVTVKGSGSLKIEDGSFRPMGANDITIRECRLEVDRHIESTVEDVNFRITDDAYVSVNGYINVGWGSDRLTVDGAELDCGSLQSLEARFINGAVVNIEQSLSQTRALLVDETSTFYLGEDCSFVGIDFLREIKLLGQDMSIKGPKLAVYGDSSEIPPKIVLPEGAVSPSGAPYDVSTFFSPGKDRVYTTIYEKGVNDPIYDTEAEGIYDYPILGGSTAFVYQSPQVKEAKEKVGQIQLKAYSQAYAKTKKQKRKMKVWWEQLNEEKQEVTGYEIARSQKKDSGYKIMFSSPTERYFNTASLTKGTRYYYKVRAYQQVNYTRYYSDWSNVTYKTAK